MPGRKNIQLTKKQRAIRERVAELNKKILALAQEKEAKAKKISSLLKEAEELKLTVADIEIKDGKLKIALEVEQSDCVHYTINNKCVHCGYEPPVPSTFTF